MFNRIKKSFAVLCAAAIIGSSFHVPVYAASRPQDDDSYFEGLYSRTEEIKKNGGEEIGGIAFYKLDPKAQKSIDDISYEDFSKKYIEEMTEESAERGKGKGAVVERDWYSYSSKYMYNQLSSNEKKLYDQLYAYCMYYLTNSSSDSKSPANYKIKKINYGDYLKEEAISPSFNFSKLGLSIKQSYYILVIFQYENPQFYFLSPSCYYMYGKDYKPESVVISFFNKFSNSVERAKITNRTFDKIDSYAEIVKKQATDAEKARKAEELIMSNNKYALSLQIRGKDYREWYDQSMYSTFNLGYTVCAGYAKGTSAVLRKAGMSAMCVTSVNHAWNLVKVDGKWYTLDSTWDDSDDGEFSKDYFLKSDKYTTTHDKKDLYGRPAHVRDELWKKAPLCKADYGKEWAAKYQNINNRFDKTDNKQSEIKKKIEKTKYNPDQNKKTLSVKLSKSVFIYDGKKKTPSVKVTFGGKTLNSSDYSVKYSEGRINPGIYKVTVTLKSKSGHTGSKSVKFTIAPKKTEINNVTNTASSAKISWKKVQGKISGYKIEMSTSADFTKDVKRISIKNAGVTSHEFESLENGKTYYFRIRAYKSTGNGMVYSKWSSAKSVKVTN